MNALTVGSRLLGLTLVAALVAACSPSSITPPDGGFDATVNNPPRCIAGASAACGCTDGRTGAQICGTDGVYQTCQCTGPVPTGLPRCIPNMTASCQCADLRVGAQMCQADGTYSVCSCNGVAPTDAGDVPVAPTDGGIASGCNADGGIECDGDWAGHCAPGCAATQCCSPQHGAFACVARDAQGHCPAADLWIDRDRVNTSLNQEFHYFAANNCALIEHCVSAPGVRRLLRFDTRTPNTGGADMFLGPPSTSNPNFEYSSCHNHYHFNTYANYELLNSDGTIAATGHKQAFCLIDLDHYDAPASFPAHYNCGNQGIQMGFADIYGSGLDCQWVDITDVAPGTYSLRIRLNEQHLLNEANYDNNVIDVPVTINAATPDEMNLDPTNACVAMQTGTGRTCGWTVEGPARACTPGAHVTAGCSATCGLGSCTGDTMIRVYEGDRTAPGSITPDVGSIAINDDSGCPRDGGNDLCSSVGFTCPASGRYTLLTGPYRSNETAVCTVAVTP